jgi:hypothetical protein
MMNLFRRNSGGAQQAQRHFSQAMTRMAPQRPYAVPQGAPMGSMAGQAGQMIPQQFGGVPQGAQAGYMGQCGPGGTCPGTLNSMFGGMGGPSSPWAEPYSLLGVNLAFANFSPATLSITCGNSFFHGCGGKVDRNQPWGQILISSVIAGFNSFDRTCGPDAAFDIGWFATDDCWCPFDFGCFSNLAPLLITFDPVDTLSVLPTLNMIIVGEKLNFFDECWPFGFPGGPVRTPGFSPGLPPSSAPPGSPAG